ncbi:3-keto-disaccharide hydrolase [Thalassobellus citreus]|uniref:3-keto-disaccharide hydrolase n=1 Tax=Thalassobellus citreus TaxID=3367752 RepID=UPI00379A7C06
MKHIILPLITLCLFTWNSVYSQLDPKLTETWSPAPKTVTPGDNQKAPSDAIILFDGSNLDEWTSETGEKPAWNIENNILTILPGSDSIKTKRKFADCQLHLEWRTPTEIKGKGQNRGNSGVYFQEKYEVQILDSYDNTTYSNGQAGAIYKQHIPKVNASKKPGTWQTYDIIYTAPRFNMDSTLKTPAYITVLHNGIIIQNHVEIKGDAVYTGQPTYKKHNFQLPLLLQDHGCPVSFRNIWIRETNVIKLFNQENLEGWYTYLDSIGINKDPEHNFSVKNNLLRIEGKQLGYIGTEKSYSNYYLKAVFKWGDKRYPPRENMKRDNGILYHFAKGEKDKIWPKSIECQIQEGDCGDYWCVDGTTADSPNKSEISWNMKHIIRTENFENPKGEWNTIEVICNGNESEHYVNGHLVNWATSLSESEGKILLQSEYAETYYKSIELIPY